MPKGVYKRTHRPIGRPFPKGHKLNLGKKFTEEHKENLSKACIGRTPWNKDKKGLQIAWNRGKEHMVGDKHPLWRGGGKNWLQRYTKTRDDYTCQICGLRDPEIMEADHIKPKCDYPELASCIENLITICPNCHRRKTNRELRERAGRNKKND